LTTDAIDVITGDR